MNPKDFQNELAYYDAVKEIIRTKINILQDKKVNLRQQVIQERKDMWEENRHAIRDFDDVVELSALDRNVTDAEAQFERNEAELDRLNRMRTKPYFGRIDFEDGRGRSRTLYIGLHSLITDEPHKMYIADWRAPAASMFYAFDVGQARYETAGQLRTVEMTLKRQYEIADGQLKYAYDTDSSMHDSILGKVLSQNTDRKLKVIIGSIQKEQNEAIRCNTRKNILIHGLAGSGKTSVGLHRLAYILYQNRDTITSDNILILSNNSVYSAYVASILPELGEREAETLVFRDLLAEGMDEGMRFEDLYTQLEYIDIPQAGEMRAVRIRQKYSIDLLKYCIRYFDHFEYRIPEIRYKDTVIFSPAIFRRKWTNIEGISFRKKYEKINNLIIQSIETYFLQNREAVCRDIVAGHDEFLLKDEIPLLFRKTVHRCMEHAVQEFSNRNQLDPKKLLLDIMQGYFGESADEICGELEQALNSGRLLYEDALLYMLIKVLMGKIASRRDIFHIVVDEAQDYNPIQLYIVKALYPQSTFTVLADIFQTVNPYTTIQDYACFAEIFGDDLVQICLEKTYRSSGEINALAFRLIDSEAFPIREQYSYFDRRGKKPEYWIAVDVYACIPTVLKKLKGYNTAAIITADADSAAAVYQWLRTQKGFGREAQLICTAEDKINSPLVVIPLLFAKGLEFDAVVLVGLVHAMECDTLLRKKLYLGCTRALHELYLLEKSALPESLSDCRDLVRIRTHTQ